MATMSTTTDDPPDEGRYATLACEVCGKPYTHMTERWVALCDNCTEDDLEDDDEHD
jgi:hypothetical protein